MDRLRREGNPPTGQLASPVPQYKDTVLNDWAELQGEGGASYVKDRDALAKLEQARVLLSGVATEAKLEEARALLESVAGKDFATQATLAQVKSELELVKAELAAIKANQLSGDQKVKLSGTKLVMVDIDVPAFSSDSYVGTNGYKIGSTQGLALFENMSNGFFIKIENKSSGLFQWSFRGFHTVANVISGVIRDFPQTLTPNQDLAAGETVIITDTFIKTSETAKLDRVLGTKLPWALRFGAIPTGGAKVTIMGVGRE